MLSSSLLPTVVYPLVSRAYRFLADSVIGEIIVSKKIHTREKIYATFMRRILRSKFRSDFNETIEFQNGLFARIDLSYNSPPLSFSLSSGKRVRSVK